MHIILEASAWVDRLRARDLAELTRLRIQLCSCALPWLVAFVSKGGANALISLLMFPNTPAGK